MGQREQDLKEAPSGQERPGSRTGGPLATRRSVIGTPSTAKWLSISGALITGVAGVAMAIWSVVSGEATGGGALLAASALAFGLLAFTLHRNVVQPAASDSGEKPDSQYGGAPAPGARPRQPLASITESDGQPLLSVSHVDGSLIIRPRHEGGRTAPIDAEPLTGRERQVLALVAEGYSNKLIASTLSISEGTVKGHLTMTMGKLGASDRTHAVVTAVRLGWLRI